MPTLAPIAAGTAKPIVPRPPELIQVFGLLVADEVRGPHLVLADARRCRSASGPAIAPSRSMTYCGDEAAVVGRVVAERVLLLHAGQERDPGLVVAGVAGVGLGLQRDDQVADHLAAVADDRDVGVRGSCRSRPGRCRRG